MVQWIKNLIAVARVAVEVHVYSLAQHSGLKDPALLQLRPWVTAARTQSWAKELPCALGVAVKKISYMNVFLTSMSRKVRRMVSEHPGRLTLIFNGRLISR